VDKQLEFSFMKEANILDRKVCGNCKNVNDEEGICQLDYSEVSGDHSCGFWEQDPDKGMEEISVESKQRFHRLMDKYKISEEDKREIFNCCHWF